MFLIERESTLNIHHFSYPYLQILRQYQGSVRLNLISTHMGLPRQTIEMLEGDFIRLGLVDKTEKGRVLTSQGIAHLRSTAT